MQLKVLDQDSDDEALNLASSSPEDTYSVDNDQSSNNDEENLVNIIPTPLNGNLNIRSLIYVNTR